MTHTTATISTPQTTAQPDDAPQPQHLHTAVLIVLAIAMLLAAVRLLRGPSLVDRVVALDLLAIFAAGAIAIAAIDTDRHELLIVAVLVALLAFMGTTAFAMFLERRGIEDA